MRPAPRCAGIRRSLDGQGFEVVAEVADAESAIEAASRLSPDVCLLDPELPGSGIRAAGEISEAIPAAIVMLASSDRSDDLFDALRAGACGYLLTSTDPARLAHALRGVLAGEAALPRALVSRLIDEFRSQGRRRRVTMEMSRGPELTSREWEVMELVRTGLNTRQAADRLFVSPVTVRRHMSAVIQKLGVPDRESALAVLQRA